MSKFSFRKKKTSKTKQSVITNELVFNPYNSKNRLISKEEVQHILSLCDIDYEIQNLSLFFIGIIILILGFLIIIFDYPQIQYFESMDLKSYSSLDQERKETHERIVMEFSIGLGIIGIGSLVTSSSFLKRFENGIR